MSVRKYDGFKYECDRCGVEHDQKNAQGHYTQSTPPEWMSLTWWVGGERAFGEAGARGNQLLCPACTAPIFDAINHRKSD